MPKTKSLISELRDANRRLQFAHNTILYDFKSVLAHYELAKAENYRLRKENCRVVKANLDMSQALDATIGCILFGIKNKK